jgi:hypothetical protein
MVVIVGLSVVLGTGVRVRVGGRVRVNVGARVAVRVGNGVRVRVAVRVGTGVRVEVRDGVALGVGVAVRVRVGVRLAVGVRLGVCVRVGVGVGVAVLESWITGLTVVLWLALLFETFGSTGLAATAATLLRTPVVVVVTMIVTKALALAGSVPRLQVTLAAATLHVGAPGAEETKAMPGGRLSVRTTPLALSGPLFVTVRV